MRACEELSLTTESVSSRRKLKLHSVKKIAVKWFVHDTQLNLTIFFLSAEQSSHRTLAVFRSWKNKQLSGDVEEIKSLVRGKVPADNQATLE